MAVINLYCGFQHDASLSSNVSGLKSPLNHVLYFRMVVFTLLLAEVISSHVS